ncbi:MAG: hypothetical protein ACRC42_02300 [Mycoplasma sp.]
MKTWIKATLGILGGLAVIGATTNIYYAIVGNNKETPKPEDVTHVEPKPEIPKNLTVNGITETFNSFKSYEDWMGNELFFLDTFPGKESKIDKNTDDTNFEFISATYEKSKGKEEDIIVTFSADRKFDANKKVVLAEKGEEFQYTTKINGIKYGSFFELAEQSTSSTTVIELAELLGIDESGENGTIDPANIDKVLSADSIASFERTEAIFTVNNFKVEENGMATFFISASQFINDKNEVVDDMEFPSNALEWQTSKDFIVSFIELKDRSEENFLALHELTELLGIEESEDNGIIDPENIDKVLSADSIASFEGTEAIFTVKDFKVDENGMTTFSISTSQFINDKNEVVENINFQSGTLEWQTSEIKSFIALKNRSEENLLTLNELKELLGIKDNTQDEWEIPSENIEKILSRDSIESFTGAEPAFAVYDFVENGGSAIFSIAASTCVNVDGQVLEAWLAAEGLYWETSEIFSTISLVEEEYQIEKSLSELKNLFNLDEQTGLGSFNFTNAKDILSTNSCDSFELASEVVQFNVSEFNMGENGLVYFKISSTHYVNDKDQVVEKVILSESLSWQTKVESI